MPQPTTYSLATEPFTLDIIIKMDIGLRRKLNNLILHHKRPLIEISIKAPQALHNTPPLLGAPKVIL